MKKHLLQLIRCFLVMFFSAAVLSSCQKTDDELNATPAPVVVNPTQPVPTITGISQANGVSGMPVTITGTNFSINATEDTVKFNGTYAPVITASATSLTVNIPDKGTSGVITLRVKNSATVTGPVFTYQTALISITPDNGKPGQTVEINGNDFITNTGGNIVKFNGVAATVTAATSTKLTVTIPANASTGLVSVLANTGTTLTGLNFTVNPADALNWQEVGTSVSGVSFKTATLDEKVMIGGVAFAPVTPYILYSSNGASFINVAAKLPFSSDINTISQITANSSRFYVSTDAGLASTTDGNTWSLLFDSNVYGVAARSVIFVGNDIYLSTSGTTASPQARVYKSTDNGATWVKIGEIPFAAGGIIKTNDNVFYGGGGNLIYSNGLYTSPGRSFEASQLVPYKSTDLGKTWVKATPNAIGNSWGYTQSTFVSINNTVYGFYTDTYGVSVSPINLFKSPDGGATWQKQTAVPTFMQAGLYEAITTKGNMLIVGGGAEKLSVTTDNGASFQRYALPSGTVQTLALAKTDTYLYLISTLNGIGGSKIYRAPL